MSSLPPGLPEPITPRKQPLPPARGRDRALSSSPSSQPAPAPAAASATVTSAPPFAPAPTLADQFKPKRPPRRLPWLILLAILGLAAAIGIPLGLGIYYGNQQHGTYAEQQALEHFQRALAYESETYTDQAMGELEIALKFKPDYPEAQLKLAQLKAAHDPVKQEPNDVAIAKQLYESAADAYAQERWDDSLDLLEELRRVKSDYRVSDVQKMLIIAYINAGKQALASGQVDLAQRRFEAVLKLDPSNKDGKSLREQAVLYSNGTEALDSGDWQSAVLNLADLFEQDPDFYNVKQQLRDAHQGYGEAAEKQGAFCIAAREYGAAANLGASSDIVSKATAASESCKQAILNPTPIPVATASAEGVAYIFQQRVNNDASCNGVGGVTGLVRDVTGQPVGNVAVKIYNDAGYNPPPARSEMNGAYTIILGNDPSIFHVVVLNDDGTYGSAIVDASYPGGSNAGCHIVVDWIKIK